MTILPSRLFALLLVACLCVSLVGCGGQGNYWQTIKSDFGKMPRNLIQDSNDLIHNPNHVGVLLVAGAASGITRLEYDKDIDRHRRKSDTFPRDMTIAFGTAGSPVTHFGVAGAAYVFGLLAEKDHTREVSFSVLEALSYTGLYTMTLKLIAQDDSPNGERLAWPSGHTSSSVTVAAVLDSYYGPWVGIPLYALSGLVAYERIDTREHWTSDVIFGAAIGYTIGKTVADRCRPQLFGFDLVPYADPMNESAGVAFMKTF